MNGLPYYKAYPRDFVEGTIGLPFEIKCAYRVVIDLIYMQGGRLPDDARYISGHLGCSIRKWNSIRDELIARGKLTISGQFITNHRADKELETLSKLQDKQAENARRPNKNKDLEKPRLNHTEPEPEPDISKRDTNVSLALSAPEPASPLAEAVTIYNETASRVGWPKMQKLTPARSQALRGRLKDCGGIEGWQIAMSKAEASNFLCGRATGTTPATFDWITKQANFTKLMEGNYDNRTGNVSKHSHADAADRQIAFAAAARRTPSQDCF
jgi:uncharacterized protein YdaU (DUF1376 family)